MMSEKIMQFAKDEIKYAGMNKNLTFREIEDKKHGSVGYLQALIDVSEQFGFDIDTDKLRDMRDNL